MKVEIKKWALLSLISALSCFGENSPFATQGLGLERSPRSVREIGLGYAGLSYVSKKGASLLNPSIMGFNTVTTFQGIIESGVNFIEDEAGKNALSGGTLPFLSFNFQAGILGHLSFSYFQRFNRNFSYVATDSQKEEITSVTSGSNELIFGWGRTITKNFAVGASSNLLLGRDLSIRKTIYKDEKLKGLEGDTTEVRRSGFYPTLSAIFVEKKYSVAASATFPFKFTEETQKSVYGQSSNKGKEQEFTLPTKVALGFTYRLKYNKTLVLDMVTTDWDQKISDKMNRSFQVGLGYEFFKKRGLYDSYVSKIIYRVGVGYERLYVNEVNQFRLTTGLGLPLGKRGSVVDLALEGGRRGSIANDLIQENYVKLFVSMTGAGVWGNTRRVRR